MTVTKPHKYVKALKIDKKKLRKSNLIQSKWLNCVITYWERRGFVHLCETFPYVNDTLLLGKRGGLINRDLFVSPFSLS